MSITTNQPAQALSNYPSSGTYTTNTTAYHHPSFTIPTGTVTFGSHTFEADQLGQLLSHLQSIHFPEHCV